MNRDSLVFVEHIMESIEAIESFSKNISKDKLIKNRLRRSAIIRELEIIGEAVKNLTEIFTDKYSGIEWKKIAGLRDKLIHNYFGVDLNVVWDVIKEDLPELKKNIKKILDEEKK